MGLLFGTRNLGDTLNQLVPVRQGRNPLAPIMKPDDELRNSIVWAALRLRADLISTLPLRVWRQKNASDLKMSIPLPSNLARPGSLVVGGPLARIDEWLYATQMDLDRFGNAFGMIVSRNSMGMPTRIDLIPAANVTVSVKQGVVSYSIGGKPYDASEIWHEKQNVVSGLPVGLSPVAYAAMALGQYQSAEQFAATWFTSGALPSAVMKNSKKTLTPQQSQDMKTQVKTTLSSGDVLVVGNDWDYTMISVPPAQAQFLEAMNASAADCARFFNMPGDLLDLAVSGQSITYANIGQRNLQALTMNLGPSIYRREQMLTSLLPAPQYVDLDTSALLRMDPATEATVVATNITARRITPNEVRDGDNRPPFTPEQEAEFIRLFPPKNLQFPQVAEIEDLPPLLGTTPAAPVPPAE